MVPPQLTTDDICRHDRGSRGRSRVGESCYQPHRTAGFSVLWARRKHMCCPPDWGRYRTSFTLRRASRGMRFGEMRVLSKGFVHVWAAEPQMSDTRRGHRQAMQGLFDNRGAVLLEKRLATSSRESRGTEHSADALWCGRWLWHMAVPPASTKATLRRRLSTTPRERWPQLASVGSTVATARSPLSPGSRSQTPRRKCCPNPGRRPATNGTERGTTASTHPHTERGDHRQTLTDADLATSPRRRPGYRRPGEGPIKCDWLAMPAVAAVGISACPGFGPRGLRYRIRRHDAAGTGHPPSGTCGLTLQLEDRPLLKDLLTSGGRRGPVPGCSRCVVGRAGALVAACRAFGDGGAPRRKVGRPFPGSVRVGRAGVLLAAVLVVALAADQITMSDRLSLPG